jgi:hypothetical protein
MMRIEKKRDNARSISRMNTTIFIFVQSIS